MKCPHCDITRRAMVIESRPNNGMVWRRRRCAECNKVFVTKEESCTATTSMPVETQTYRRNKRTKPALKISAGKHLQDVWK